MNEKAYQVRIGVVHKTSATTKDYITFPPMTWEEAVRLDTRAGQIIDLLPPLDDFHHYCHGIG